MKDLQFTKVKVRIQDSTLDPNEPRVQESLLEQVSLRRFLRGFGKADGTETSVVSLRR